MYDMCAEVEGELRTRYVWFGSMLCQKGRGFCLEKGLLSGNEQGHAQEGKMFRRDHTSFDPSPRLASNQEPLLLLLLLLLQLKLAQCSEKRNLKKVK